MVVVGALPLRSGADNEAVADAQRRLRALGHPSDDDLPGVYGPATEAAVRAFQAARGLRVDGICGDETWACMVDAGLVLGDRLLYERVPLLRGDDVAALQSELGGLGFDAGRVDGFFGPHTTRAVVEFQRNAGLPTDGVCGPDTLRALRRVSGGVGGSSTVAKIREADTIRHSPPGLLGCRVALADAGEASALSDAVALTLRSSGAVVTVIHHPDATERAAAANAFEAAVFLGVTVRDEPGLTVGFYAREDFESVGGRRLAEMLVEELPDGLGNGAEIARGMRVGTLRETRMPAVLVEVGPPTAAVEHAPRLVEAMTSALARWTTEPLD